MDKPDFYFETKLWENGLTHVAGCDEVGRGCFAGPVVAASCIFSPQTISDLQKASFKGIRIDDSKRLSALQRGRADEWIRSNSLGWGIGEASVGEINRKGIVRATNTAFRRAVNMLKQKLQCGVDYLLIDAFYVPYIRGIRVPNKSEKLKHKTTEKLSNSKLYGNQLAIKKGDSRSFSIAAASIIAKVYRDDLMLEISKKYKVYQWNKNKGYGTKHHRESINKYGVTRHHRKQFVETFFRNSSFSPTRSET